MTIAAVFKRKNINRSNTDTSNMYILNEDGTKSENITEIKQ